MCVGHNYTKTNTKSIRVMTMSVILLMLFDIRLYGYPYKTKKSYISKHCSIHYIENTYVSKNIVVYQYII
jgi:hypothetical protein